MDCHFETEAIECLFKKLFVLSSLNCAVLPGNLRQFERSFCPAGGEIRLAGGARQLR